MLFGNKSKIQARQAHFAFAISTQSRTSGLGRSFRRHGGVFLLRANEILTIFAIPDIRNIVTSGWNPKMENKKLF